MKNTSIPCLSVGALLLMVSSAATADVKLYHVSPVTNKTVQELRNNSSVPTANVTIKATFSNKVASAGFYINGKRTTQYWENTAPYAMFNDVNGNYNAGKLPGNSFVVTVKGFSGKNGSGRVVEQESFRLNTGSASKPPVSKPPVSKPPVTTPPTSKLPVTKPVTQPPVSTNGNTAITVSAHTLNGQGAVLQVYSGNNKVLEREINKRETLRVDASGQLTFRFKAGTDKYQAPGGSTRDTNIFIEKVVHNGKALSLRNAKMKKTSSWCKYNKLKSSIELRCDGDASLALSGGVVANPLAAKPPANKPPVSNPGTPPSTSKGFKIAMSFDGNNNDRDDIGAFPMAMAILNKAGMKDRVVHTHFNSYVWNSNTYSYQYEDKAGDMEAQMRESSKAHSRFKIGGKLFDARRDQSGAIKDVTRVANNATAASPLKFIVGGPMHVVCEGLKRANKENLKYVTVISHSAWNNTAPNRGKDAARKVCRADASNETKKANAFVKPSIRDLVKFDQIKDQNKGLKQNFSQYDWMKSMDENVQWVRNRMYTATPNKADPSDAGMVYYAIRNDESATPAKLKQLFSSGGSAPVTPPTYNPPATGSKGIFVERNGLISIDVENTDLSGTQWRIKSQGSERDCRDSVGNYLRWDSRNNNYNGKANERALTYKINVTNPGTYQINAWSCPGSTGAKDEQNDVFVSVNGSTFQKHFNSGSYRGKSGKFSYMFSEEINHNFNHSKKFELKKGINTLQLKGRSVRFAIDNIVLFKSNQATNAKKRNLNGKPAGGL